MRTCINAWMIILGGIDLLWLIVPVNNRFLGITSPFRGVNVSDQGNNMALVGIDPRPPAVELRALPLGHRAPPAGNEDLHKRLDEFVFRPVPTTGSRVICP